jgi:hypothetical protein
LTDPRPKQRVLISLDSDLLAAIERFRPPDVELPKLLAVLVKFGYNILIAVEGTGFHLEASSERPPGAG